MRRLILIAALVLAGIVSASALLVIGAETDHDSLTAADRIPGDGDQAEQQEAQDEPQPTPEDGESEQAATEEQPIEEEGSDGEDELEVEERSAEVEDPDEAEDEEQPAQPTEVEEAVESEELDPAEIIISALDIGRKSPASEEPPVAASAYVVMEGDTLSAIADRFEVPLSDLLVWNGIESTNVLVVGQKLRLPVSESPSDPLDPPIEVAPGVTEEGIVFGTIEDHERSVVNSAVVAIADTNREIHFIAACVDGVRRMYVKGLELPASLAQAYWRIDLGPLNLDRWTVEDGLVETPRSDPLFDELQDAQTLWLRLGGIDLNFSIESMFPSDIHINLVHCGQ